MLARAITLAGGLAGAAGLSQFPEFSQQYVQRLGGAVDELTRVVEEFDADAAENGLARSEALVDLAQGGTMGAARAETMAGTITRRDRLADDLQQLQTAGPFTRASMAARFSDPDIATRALENYKPALPITFEGAAFAATGLVLGLAAMTVLIRLLTLPFRLTRRKTAQDFSGS